MSALAPLPLMSMRFVFLTVAAPHVSSFPPAMYRIAFPARITRAPNSSTIVIVTTFVEAL